MPTQLQHLLDRPVGQMSVRELILVGVVAGICIIVVGKIRRYRLRKGLAAHTVEMRCPDCQWRGRAGRYVRRCPKCGSGAIQSIQPEKELER